MCDCVTTKHKEWHTCKVWEWHEQQFSEHKVTYLQLPGKSYTFLSLLIFLISIIQTPIVISWLLWISHYGISLSKCTAN